MEDENVIRTAKEVFTTLCAMLDDKDWRYERDEDKLCIQLSARGGDLPFAINIQVDPERQLVILISPMPFETPVERRREMAVAVAQANYGMVDGSFDYDFANTGRILFRQTTSFRESLIGKELLEYLLGCACYTIDRYNDKFFMVCQNTMTIDEVLDFIN